MSDAQKSRVDTASNIHEFYETVGLTFRYVSSALHIDTGKFKMKDRTVDVAIIGAGTAGMAAYRRAVEHTSSVLLIEAERYGTTCARVGCMPSKLLIAAAEAAMAGSEASGFGVHFDKPRIDGPAVLGRVRSERDRFVKFVVDAVQEWPEEHRVIARAEFVDDHTLRLSDGTSVKAEYIIIATGSRPRIPADFRELGDRLHTSDDVFDWEDLPESVAVFGGGAIGLELGQALHLLGVRVSVFGKDNAVAQLSDPEVLTCARRILVGRLAFHADAKVLRMENTGNCVEIDHEIDNECVTERFERVLLAIGRQPNVDKLGLANTSLSCDGKGIPECNPQTRVCGVSNILIAGDADSAPPLLHLAAFDGKTAGSNTRSDTRVIPALTMLSVVFCHPQIMQVGERYQALCERKADFKIGSIDWQEQGRARVMRVNKGLLRLYGEVETERLLGAEMIGPAAEHLAHLLAWSLQSGATVSELLARPYYHPCIEEGLRTALRDLEKALGVSNREQIPRSLDCGPGS